MEISNPLIVSVSADSISKVIKYWPVTGFKADATSVFLLLMNNVNLTRIYFLYHLPEKCSTTQFLEPNYG
jgi:hypothetical protein